MKINMTSGAKSNYIGKAVLGRDSFSIDGVKTDRDGNTVERKQFTFRTADLPDDLPDGFAVENGKNYLVRVTADGKLDGIRRAAGTYEVKVDGFSTKTDGSFFVQEKSGDYGSSYSAVVNLVVQSEIKKSGSSSDVTAGVIYPYYLPLGNERRLYFGAGKGLVEFNPTFNKAQKMTAPAEKVYNFLFATGLAERDIKVSGDDIQDILEALDKVLKRTKPVLLMTVKNGYPDTLSVNEDDEDAEDFDEVGTAEYEEPEEEETKPKAKARPDLSDDDE